MGFNLNSNHPIQLTSFNVQGQACRSNAGGLVVHDIIPKASPFRREGRPSGPVHSTGTSTDAVVWDLPPGPVSHLPNAYVRPPPLSVPHPERHGGVNIEPRSGNDEPHLCVYATQATVWGGLGQPRAVYNWNQPEQSSPVSEQSEQNLDPLEWLPRCTYFGNDAAMELRVNLLMLGKQANLQL